MKRFFIFFFAILSALMGILLLTACAPAEHVHTWSKWQIHQQPTCTEKGVRDRSCECGEVQYGEIAANGHSAESYESDGMRHWSKCFFCHITLDEGECRYTAAALNSAIAIKKNYACAVCGIDSIYSGTFFFRENPDGESYEILLHSLCTQANIVIPETFNGKPVTHVGNFGSYPTSYLRSIKFPKTIVSVSDGFNGCSRLESVELNEGLESIGEYVFQMCYSLNEIIIPDSVTEIGAHAFQGCRSLQKLTLPPRLTRIEDATFANCPALTEITIPKMITYIGDHAFSNCEQLRIIPFSETVEFIGEAAFLNCATLTEITLPKTMTEIKRRLLEGCTSLKSIDLPPHLERLDEDAFKGCTALWEVTVPKSLDETLAFIGQGPFENTPWLTNQPNGLFYLGKHLLKYTGTMPAGTFVKDIRPDTISIVGSAFSNCTGLTGIIIPESVKLIGSNAFSNCTGLTGIIIPESVQLIGSSAFHNCTALTEVNIPKNLELIESYAFFLCKNLKSVIVPSSVKTLRSYAFEESVTIYTDAPSLPAEWFTLASGASDAVLNKTFVGCTLSEDNSYVVAFARENIKSILGSHATVNAPQRAGYTFGGWATEEGSTVAAYTSETVLSAPFGTKLYAIWIKN